MAHFLSPPGPYLGYEIDGKLAPNSVGRIQVPVGQRREILLWGGRDLSVSSSNPIVVPNDGFWENLSRGDGLRSFKVLGQANGTASLDARLGDAIWCSLQINVGTAAQVASAAMASGDDMQIALSPVQLAAVLEGGSIQQEETTSNRLWGGLQVLGGAFELVGAAALLAAPEPTMVTKVGGVVLAAHGSDTISAGLQQVFYGRPQTTLTAQAVEAAARSMGVDPDHAVKAGMVVDIAVPLVAGFAGAARIAAIRRGSISLAAEEAAGGHTIARHVGRTEAQLQARLAAETRIPAASTFRTLADAEQAVAAALRGNAAAIKSWAATARVGARLSFKFTASGPVGEGVIRATGALTSMSKVNVVLVKVAQADRIFFVLTAYPIP